MLDETFSSGPPEIFKTDRRSWFTSRTRAYAVHLEGACGGVSTDRRGLALDDGLVARGVTPRNGIN